MEQARGGQIQRASTPDADVSVRDGINRGPGATRGNGDAELQLVDAARGGDERAFAAIVARYERRIRGMCWKYVRDVDLVDDLVQETFCRVFLTMDRVGAGADLSPWIHRIATNLCLDELRRRTRRPRADLAPGQDESNILIGVSGRDPGGSPEKSSQARETGELVWDAMRRVPERQRQVLVLRDVFEMGHEEISRQLDLPLGAVQGVLHRARERFKLEYVRLEAARQGDDECVKVGFVIDNISRSGLRRDRLRAVQRHLQSCAPCRAAADSAWLEPMTPPVPPPAVRPLDHAHDVPPSSPQEAAAIA